MLEPQPGEVWIITERQWGAKDYEVIAEAISDRPFIVAMMTQRFLVVLQVTDAGESRIYQFVRHQFPWDEHATRLWPPVPSWNELGDSTQLPSDLRARRLAGQA